MTETSGKGLARRRQRERLEAFGYMMTTIEERPCRESGEDLICLVAHVTAGGKDLTARAFTDAALPEKSIALERTLRRELAEQYALTVMGPPTDAELESFPRTDPLGGSPGGARQALLPGQHRDTAAEARDEESRAHAPASLTFVPTDSGVTFTIEFGGGEYDDDNVAHRTAVEVIGMLKELGPLERIQLAGPTLHEEVIA